MAQTATSKSLVQLILLALMIRTAWAQSPCSRNPCGVNGRCCIRMDLHRGYVCECRPGYSGEHCEFGQVTVRNEEEVQSDPCASDPCQNGAVCTHDGYVYRCDCPYGYSEDNTCKEPETNACDSNPCQNEGICSGDSSGYQCDCPNNCGGTNCEFKQETSSCDPNPCQNGGTCDNDGHCSCPHSYYGRHCEKQHHRASYSASSSVYSQWKSVLLGCLVAAISSRMMDWFGRSQL